MNAAESQAIRKPRSQDFVRHDQTKFGLGTSLNFLPHSVAITTSTSILICTADVLLDGDLPAAKQARSPPCLSGK